MKKTISLYDFWMRENWEIHQLIPVSADKYQVVWFDRDEKKRWTEDVEFLAVCDVKMEVLRKRKTKEHWIGAEVTETTHYRGVSSVHLYSDGSFAIDADNSDFCGVCKVGEDIEKVDYHYAENPGP